jgi:hypothetical protein
LAIGNTLPDTAPAHGAAQRLGCPRQLRREREANALDCRQRNALRHEAIWRSAVCCGKAGTKAVIEPESAVEWGLRNM